ncbi:kinesin family protein-like protein [Patellaria atrata CBS 101060]|uniref:Kinesin family protein-like protein n=1 Tax=Patellaria atrata CBS 101060 TaxID=1346257 RepID=A0A9P4S8C6_9PEZI|nr:kinesin family protein-like protein [Patellaria atrata CBS 101060]
MRPPAMRPPNSRAQTATPTLNGRTSPTESIISSASRLRSPASTIGGIKRKQRDFENDSGVETNINVVVRCRGRNEREVRENSGVVVSTNGVRGDRVDLSMGPSALSNKSYNFDKVFSPAADQGMIFDEVVAPILDEVLAGFNCTIFAYGQTGTGKTYTMSGDISDKLPLSDAAGIIPRVLHSLFTKLENDENAENSVKCSFIELYNEELRDLLSQDDNVKLKIFDDNSRRGHSTTMVQGMEESHIKNASKGIELLRLGSHKRQVAATKCNDLSSRSHTVFTVTVYTKRTSDTGEDFVSAGKLNLVDLAGSENIQRSGAENKRAAEAGLINKSLLTLGRVINALVERGSHIPYRESKLTRLLQDSLGGQTKTCIIATLSPAKSNLEETISTLDYAFRAKNIRNKPQVNQMVSKKTLLKEFTAEIEKLKSELIATRQRNGVYLTQESYEEITTESESRRILSEEQKDKIDTMEVNLRNKVEELFSLTSNFNTLKKDNEAIKVMLDGTKSILEKTEILLAHTRKNLAEETVLRKAHEKTEGELINVGHDLISTLGKTTSDLGGLHSKLRRRSDLQSVNRQHWTSSQTQVSDATNLVERRLDSFRTQQEELMANLSNRMQAFVHDELQKLGSSQSFLQEKAEAFEVSEKEINAQTTQSHDKMNEVLEEIKSLREDVKQKVGAGLNDLSAAARRISAGIITELDSFHTQVHSSYASLGKEFRTTFDDLTKKLNEQQSEVERLRRNIVSADQNLIGATQSASERLKVVVEEERKRAADERVTLLQQITSLVNGSAEVQEQRLANSISGISQEVVGATALYNVEHEAYNHDMDSWTEKSKEILQGVSNSRDNVKTKIKADFAAANDHTTSLRNTTTSVHDETVKIVSEQMAHMDTQLHSLDEIVSRVRAQNEAHHEAHTKSLSAMSANVQASYTSIGDHFSTSFKRVQDLDSDMTSRTAELKATLPNLGADSEIREPLRSLREEIESRNLVEYAPTGETPQRVQYSFPTTLPRTEGHDIIISKMRDRALSSSDNMPSPSKSPSKSRIFTDVKSDDEVSLVRPRPGSAGSAPSTSLRELDANATAGALNDSVMMMMPPMKRQNTVGVGMEKVESKLPMKKGRMTVAGLGGLGDRENLTPNFSASVGPGTGRSLRSGRSP